MRVYKRHGQYFAKPPFVEPPTIERIKLAKEALEATKLWTFRFSVRLQRIFDTAIPSRDIRRLNTVADLLEESEATLLRRPELGRKSLAEVRKFLASHGLSLNPYRHDCIPRWITDKDILDVSARVINIVLNSGCGSRHQLRSLVKSGKIKAYRNVGRHAYLELCRWMNLEPDAINENARLCPHCGKPIAKIYQKKRLDARVPA